MTDKELMPVAWMHIEEGELIAFENDKNIAEQCEYCVPLYTAPPQREWQGLTDEEVRDLWSWSMTAEAERTANTQQHAFVRAIEAKLKEKNG